MRTAAKTALSQFPDRSRNRNRLQRITIIKRITLNLLHRQRHSNTFIGSSCRRNQSLSIRRIDHMIRFLKIRIRRINRKLLQRITLRKHTVSKCLNRCRDRNLPQFAAGTKRIIANLLQRIRQHHLRKILSRQCRLRQRRHRISSKPGRNLNLSLGRFPVILINNCFFLICRVVTKKRSSFLHIIRTKTILILSERIARLQLIITAADLHQRIHMTTACPSILIGSSRPGIITHSLCQPDDRVRARPTVAASVDHHAECTLVSVIVIVLRRKLHDRLRNLTVTHIRRNICRDVRIHHMIHINLGVILHMHGQRPSLTSGGHGNFRIARLNRVVIVILSLRNRVRITISFLPISPRSRHQTVR